MNLWNLSYTLIKYFGIVQEAASQINVNAKGREEHAVQSVIKHSPATINL